MGVLLFAKPEGIPDDKRQVMDDYIAQVKATLNSAEDIQTRFKLAVDEMQRVFQPISTWVPHMMGGMLSMALLNKVMSNHVDDDTLAALGQGLAGNVTTEMGLAVGDITDAARASRELMNHLNQTELDAKTRLAEASALAGGPEFLQMWGDFLETYGVRGPSEIDLSRQRWYEDPSSLLQMIVGGLTHSTQGKHREEYERLAVENEKAAHKIVDAAYQGGLGFIRGPLVRRLTRVSSNLMPLREHHKFLMIRFLGLVKPIILDVGQLLHEEGRLALPDDIWFLTIPEILNAFESPTELSTSLLQTLVNERRADHERYREMTPPRVVTSEGEIPIPKLDGGDAHAGALVGTPVSAGIVEGIAKVVLNPSQEALNPGEILVAPFTDPGWTPLFVNAAGLITEVGGLMTHGSVVAREYGIPAVVGVMDATKQIQTGDRVRVHGDAGYVEFLDVDVNTDAEAETS
ncbi:MAG: PEP-utilizing enzyme [Bacteroidota bacterium]